MDEMEVIETLESAWFFSNVFSSKLTKRENPKINSEPEPELESGSDSSEPSKPTNQTLENQAKPTEIQSPLNSPQEKPLTRRLIEVPATEPVVSEVSKSPRRREEDERRRMRRRRQRSYNNRGICRDLNLEDEIDICGGIGELKSNAVLKDERAMKRHLKTWAVVVASSSVAHNRPMLALCC